MQFIVSVTGNCLKDFEQEETKVSSTLESV